jgi:hypothetical protein
MRHDVKRLFVGLALVLGFQSVHAQTYDVRCAMRFDGKGNKVAGPGRLIYKKDKNLLIYSEVDLGQEMTIEINPEKSEIERVGSYITKFRFAYKFRDNPQLFLFIVGSGKPIDTKLPDVEVSFTATRVDIRPDGLAGGVFTDVFTSCKYNYTP